MVMGDAAEKEGWFDRLLGRWWGKVLFGLGIALVGALVFSEMAKLDSGEKESMRVHWLLAALYKIGGKWAAAGVLWLVGLVALVLGIRQVLAPKKPEAQPPEKTGK
jgi:hypothetical protein